MRIQADRLAKIPPYSFAELRKRIQQASASGVDVISLAIGDPVEPTPNYIIEALREEALNPSNHQYPKDEERGMAEFRKAVARWYNRKYEVSLDPETEIIALSGSKEGVHNFMMAVVNPGDIVLMTDPGYPAYRANILMVGAESYNVPIIAENSFLPVLEDIPRSVCQKGKAFFFNYPNNPTGACASQDFFTRLVAWANKHQILLVHDNPYSEIVFPGGSKLSLMQISGAKDISVEFNSLSKPYNMTGWRIGMAVGNAKIIRAMSKVKENVDSGVFSAIQLAGIKALDEGDSDIEEMVSVYQRRRELVLNTFTKKGAHVDPGKGTFYLWLPVPDGLSSLEFAARLFDKTQVLVAPGTLYGENGEGFFRVSLTVSDDRLAEASERIRRHL